MMKTEWFALLALLGLSLVLPSCLRFEDVRSLEDPALTTLLQASEETVVPATALQDTTHIRELIKRLPSQRAVTLCKGYSLGSSEWRTAFLSLCTHPKAEVIGYVFECGQCDNPVARYYAYRLAYEMCWDELLPLAKQDLHTTIGVGAPNTDIQGVCDIARIYIEELRIVQSRPDPTGTVDLLRVKPSISIGNCDQVYWLGCSGDLRDLLDQPILTDWEALLSSRVRLRNRKPFVLVLYEPTKPLPNGCLEKHLTNLRSAALRVKRDVSVHVLPTPFAE